MFPLHQRYLIDLYEASVIEQRTDNESAFILHDKLDNLVCLSMHLMAITVPYDIRVYCGCHWLNIGDLLAINWNFYGTAGSASGLNIV